MRLKAIKDEAERLVREHGPGALDFALEAKLQAKRQRNQRLERYMGKVATAVARQVTGTPTSGAE